MNTSIIRNPVLFITLIFSFVCSNINAQCSTTHPDYNALVAIYTALDGPNWTNNSGWPNDDAPGMSCNPCTENWFGIGCTNNRVDYINLSNNALSGPFPTQLSDLVFLRELWMENNMITDNIPNSISSLDSLIIFAFNNNKLTGAFPTGVFNMQKLTVLRLGNNEITDFIPFEIGEFPFNVLWLHNNNMIGCFPPSLYKLCNITNLRLYGNTALPNEGDTALFCSSGEGVCCNQDMSTLNGNPIDPGIYASNSKLRIKGSLTDSANYLFRSNIRFEIQGGNSLEIPTSANAEVFIGECEGISAILKPIEKSAK